MTASVHKPNRLARETSPYLLQHAHNPVDWFPWGDEAFAEARRRDCPVFLSIGYSTCYWCHVMERESFESEEVAAQMNRDFLCIKVDREERPDLDDIYMAATQMTTGHGGWPMSVFLEPSKLRPFYCGTYFPPDERGGMRSFPQILGAIATAWKERREQVSEQSQTLADAVSEHLGRQAEPVPVGLAHVSKAAQTLLRMLDGVLGGFGTAPKFPQPVFLELLLDVREAAADDQTRTAVDHAVRLTLSHMARGGINDQVGGGFHRYSVDARWLVPHFEKMLYDNAQLASVYARAGAIYDEPYFRHTARRTLEYVLREMTQSTGAFSSAQDAEVDGREGANYIWRREDFDRALDADDAGWASAVYGLDGGSNFTDPHNAGAPASNVLFLSLPPEEFAAQFHVSREEFESRLARINEQLYAFRSRRKQPRLDDKVITAWNGMMIAGLARAAMWLDDPKYLDAAEKAAAFIVSSMRDREGNLLRTSRGGTGKTAGFLEDYAFLIDGLLAIQNACQKIARPQSSNLADPLGLARDFTERANSLFGAPSGGYFDTRADQADIFIRARSSHDGAIPSGASVMLANLVALHELTGEPTFSELARGSLASLSSAISDSPVGAANAVRSLLRMVQRGLVSDAGSVEEAPSRTPFTPVEIYATEERIQVGKDHPAKLRLVLKIADGYHINAAAPGDANLVPLRVGVVNGSGIAAYADYPAGDRYGTAGELRVHKGSVEFDVAVERTGEWKGRPLLAVTFQACTETECLAPMTAELDVAIDPLD